jgi:TIR domain-containing protein
MTAADQATTGFEFSGPPPADRTAQTPVAAQAAAATFDVFISYSHVDKATADATCATLEQAGIRCWIAPRDIMPGDEWGAAIVKAIDQCRAMVLIFSSSANSSKQIRREVERAVNAGVPIIPVRIENVAPTEAMAYFMSTVHWLDAMTAPLDDHLQRLAASIKALLKTDAPDSVRVDERDGHEATATKTSVKKPMFAEIMNFSYQRTSKQAFGWYLMYLLIGIVIGLAVGQIATMANTIEGAARVGLAAGQLSAIPYHLALAVLLIWHRAKDASGIMLILASIVLSVWLGALGGLIPLAILSRRPVMDRARVQFARGGFVSSVHQGS